MLVLVAVEKRGRGSGRARMEVIPDFRSSTLLAFLKRNVESRSIVYTDGFTRSRPSFSQYSNWRRWAQS